MQISGHFYCLYLCLARWTGLLQKREHYDINAGSSPASKLFLYDYELNKKYVACIIYILHFVYFMCTINQFSQALI